MNFEFKSTFKISKIKAIFRQAVLIWLITCVLATLYHWVNGTTGHGIEKVLLISLVISLSAMVLLIPNLYFLNTFISKRYRITYGFISILALSALVVVIFIKMLAGFPVEQHTVVLLLAPYCLAAEVSFFVIAKNLFRTEEGTANETTR
jgi:hypothetical protein